MKFTAICLTALLLLVGAFSPVWADDVKEFQVSGHVIMPGGSPAAGAVVDITYPKDGGRVVADESGSYTLRLAPGEYMIGAHLGQHVLTTDRTIEIDPNGTITGATELKLDPAAVVAGRVTDRSTGKPVAGAKVMMRYYGEREAETDRYGVYRFEAVPRSANTIVVVKEGFSRPKITFSAVGQSFIQIDLDVRPEGILKGRVTDDGGKPLSGVQVGPRLYHYDFEISRTDGNGNYTLRGLDPTQSTTVCVFADGYNSIFDRAVVFPAGKSDAGMDFRLTLDVSGSRTITGRVTDRMGNPIKDAIVNYGIGYGYATTRTDGSGLYSLNSVDESKSIVAVEAKGFAPSFRFAEAKVSKTIDFIMGPGHYLEGRFVDEAGKPLQGVSVSVDVATPEMAKVDFRNQPYRWVDPRSKSDKNGHFRLEDLPAKGVIIEAYLSGYGRIDAMPIEVDRKDHVITMRRPGQVTGTVVSAVDGKPLKKFEIGHYWDEKGVIYTSPEGRFTLRDYYTASDETVDIFVRAPGYLISHLPGIQVQPAGKIDFNALRVRLQPSRELTGIVTDSKGKALEGVAVTMLDTEDISGSFGWGDLPEYQHATAVRTNQAGKFSFDSVPARRGVILLDKAGYARTVLARVNLLKPFKASMLPGATVGGVAVDSSGNPKKGACVSIRDGDSRINYGSTTTGPDGKFSFADLPPDAYVIEYDSDGKPERLHEFTLTTGQDYTVNWNRKEPCQVEGRVTLDGAPVEAAHIIMHNPPSGMYAGFADTGKDGTYHFAVHKPGAYSVRFSRSDGDDEDRVYFRKAINVKPGINQLDVELPSGAISGKLTTNTGKPMADVRISASHLHTEMQEMGDIQDWSRQHTQPWWWQRTWAITDTNGEFVLRGLAEGEWMIATRTEGNSEAATPVARVRIGKNEKKTGVIARMPTVGSVEIKVVDGKTGKAAARTYPICVSNQGFAFYPRMKESGRSSWPGLLTGARGGILFSDLPVGRYTVHTLSETCMPARMSIEIKPGVTANYTVKTQRGQKIVFRLIEADNDTTPGRLWIGYKISKPGSSKPVLADFQGPYWGDRVSLDGPGPRTASVPIEPGIYDLQMVVRSDANAASSGHDNNLWSGKLKVKVVKGKHTIIDIPVTKR
jgi:protocatechuate 3,4-dioxygenase beta subunit